MAKYYNNQKKTGKLAGSVFAIRFGEVIERAYNPIVANPSTPNQVAARAKMKLMSQLGAVIAPVIAMRREGAVSPRNRFVKTNYPSVTFSNGQADINLSAIKITNSVVSLAPINATRSQEGAQISLGASSPELSRVVYCFFSKQTDNTLRYVGSEVVTDPGTTFVFRTTKPIGITPHVVYAYGVRDNTTAASAVFGDMVVLSAEEVAKLIVSSSLTEADVTLTETRFAEIPTA